MGKHTAEDDAAVDPLVADALARRSGEPGSGQHEGPDRPGREGDLGWPGEPAREGEGLGWPAEPEPSRDAARADEQAGRVESGAAAVARGRRPGWRRLFGASPAA